ncbi:uncharacterized protein [Rhodnius prolixus]|uniref:Uncharacterized protein n=1 Tax=Rhodnius prolixus TaxID=13249 RepID=T1HSR4_RHOPR
MACRSKRDGQGINIVCETFDHHNAACCSKQTQNARPSASVGTDMPSGPYKSTIASIAEIGEVPKLSTTWAKKQKTPLDNSSKNSLPLIVNEDCFRQQSTLCLHKQATSYITGEDSQVAREIEHQRNMFLKQQQCEQIKEKDELRRARKLANEEMQVDAEYESMFFNRCSKLEQNLRQEEKYRIQDFNKLLAKQKKIEKATEKANNVAMNMAHMYNVLTSDLMMENAAGASSALGEGRLRRGQFKGQTEVDLANLKAFQLEQISQKKVHKEVEEMLEGSFNEIQDTLMHEYNIEKKKLEKDKKIQLMQLQQENLRLANIQRLARKEAESRARDNIPSEEYFNHFGRSMR